MVSTLIRDVPIQEQVGRLIEYWAILERIHQMFDQAESKVKQAIGRPICMEKCGLCCQHASPIAYGFEAEYACTILLGNASLIGRVAPLGAILPRIRDWLTAPGKYTYGRSLDSKKAHELALEFKGAVEERCCFLGDDMRCMIHYARPLACRAYGVVHMANQWCPRPLGIGEDGDSRTIWDPDHPEIPIRPLFNALLASVNEFRFRRHGFFATMIYERLRAKDLAGLLDDGKLPIVKAYQGVANNPAILWQEDVEKVWKAEAADRSIADTVPMVETDGHYRMVVGKSKGKRRPR